jgi:DNA primase
VPGKGWIPEVHRERKLAALRRCLPGETQGRGKEISFFCWLPGPDGCDGKHHKPKLSVNVDSDRWHCWVCGQGGHDLLRLLALGGRDHPDYVDYSAEIERPRAEVAKEYDRVHLPKEFRPLCVPSESLCYRQAIGYLARLGVGAEDILAYRLGYAEDGPLKERIIFPSFDEHGELNFVVGRGIWERISPPYMTNGRYDKDIIFNDLLVDWHEPIVLVEGPFDALKAGTNSIPLQGKFMSDRLRDKIIARRIPAYIALDGDAIADTVRLAERLKGYGVEVHVVEWEGIKDPGEMTKAQFQEYMKQARTFGTAEAIRFRVTHSGSL